MANILQNVGQITHQGDVFLRKVSNDPNVAQGETVTGQYPGKLVVHEGEGLGHLHEIETPAYATLKLVSLKEGVKRMQLSVTKDTPLIHPEHGAIVLTPGTYDVHTQREQRSGLTRAIAD